jgi:hypothetical protein
MSKPLKGADTAPPKQCGRRYDPHLLGGTSWVPYISVWTGERTDPPASEKIIESPGAGIGYSDETIHDRDEYGVLWSRAPSHIGLGRPLFKEVHPIRQRHVMRRLLCQVCAGPADRAEQGVLWLLGDHRHDWRGWPEGMGNAHPPLCLPCARAASRLCPYLRHSHVAVRSRQCPIAGVVGGRYRSTMAGPMLVGVDTVAYDDPAVRWLQAAQLVRTLHACTVLDLDEV